MLYTLSLQQRKRNVVEIQRLLSALRLRDREKAFFSGGRIPNEHTIAVRGDCGDKVAFAVIDGAGPVRAKDSLQGKQRSGSLPKPSRKILFPNQRGGSTIASLLALAHDLFDGHVQARLVVFQNIQCNESVAVVAICPLLLLLWKGFPWPSAFDEGNAEEKEQCQDRA